MTIHILRSASTRDTPLERRLDGEEPMPHAPSVELPNGRACIPQHYLLYRQTSQTIAALVADIHFDEHTLLFAGADAQGMYVQVGLIGRENYDHSRRERPQKLVYGRKWRIDPDTPTSEVVQTTFLAIKKAREHEVRELLTLEDPESGRMSAPFSSHLDLPLMAHNTELIVQAAESAHSVPQENILSALDCVRFGLRKIYVEQVIHRPNGATLVDLKLGALPLAREIEGDLSEFNAFRFSVHLNVWSRSELLYEVMAAMVLRSDRYVEENFSYKGFARFSRNNDPLRIAQLSIATRPNARDAANAQFIPIFKAMNYQVDASRAPALGVGPLAEKNRSLIAAHGPQLAGHMPAGYEAQMGNVSRDKAAAA
jgi:hypothetical protein